MAQTTIKEIAQEAGVSVATVSRAINPHTSDDVKKSTRDRILKIVKRISYRPNAAAKRLVTGKSTNIIVFMGTKYKSAFYSDYYMKLLSGIMDVIEHSEYDLVIRMMKTHEPRFDLNKVIKGLDVGGVIVCHLETELEVSMSGIEGISIPAIILNKMEHKRGLQFMACDQFKAAYDATDYLISLGHTRIGIIKGPSLERDAVERFNGYKKALKDHALPIVSTYIEEGIFTEETGYSKIKNLMSLKERPTAIFCSSDEMAMGAFMRLRDLGIPCPKEISIIGFDGIDAGRYFVPRLTTMSQPIYDMAKEAAQKLLDNLEKDVAIEGAKVFYAQLVEGGTCAKPPSVN